MLISKYKSMVFEYTKFTLLARKFVVRKLTKMSISKSRFFITIYREFKVMIQWYMLFVC